MKNLLWFVAGAAVGVIAAHLVDKDPRGHELLADIDARIAEFTDRVGDAYREQEAKFASAVDDVRSAATSTVHTATDAVSGAVASVRDAATDLAGRAHDAAQDAVDGADDAVAAAWDATAEAAEDAKDTVSGEPSSETDPASDAAAEAWDVDLQGDPGSGRQDEAPVVDTTEASASGTATAGDDSSR